METTPLTSLDHRSINGGTITIYIILAIKYTVLGVIGWLLNKWTHHYLGGLDWKVDHEFNYHVVFMVTSMSLLAGQGLIIYRLPKVFPRTIIKALHGTIHASVIVLGSLGIYAVIKSHNDAGFDNFYSLHSWLGLAAFGVYCLQWVLGILVFVFGSFLLRDYPSMASPIKAFSVPAHRSLGSSSFMLGTIAVLAGIVEKVTFIKPENHTSDLYVPNALGMLVLGYALLVYLVLTIGPYMDKGKNEKGSDEEYENLPSGP